MDPTALAGILDAGPWAFLVIGLTVGWLVPKWVHTDLREDRDYYKGQLERALRIGETTVRVAEKVT